MAQKIMAFYDKYWCHKFKTHKTYGVTKNHGLPLKFVTPCCQMAWHVIITWKTESLSITKDNNIFN